MSCAIKIYKKLEICPPAHPISFLHNSTLKISCASSSDFIDLSMSSLYIYIYIPVFLYV